MSKDYKMPHTIKVSEAVYQKIQELRGEFLYDIGTTFNNSQALYEYFKATDAMTELVKTKDKQIANAIKVLNK